ncbi:MAG: type II toxin-antitoxin system Phd/YefM family antitoxin [Acidimicrobiales bacterium]|nr:type II toxin-antitoxin system Phd/YefM family antitoxin [Acidimicrobiales bacterium]
MTKSVGIHEVKTHFSELVDDVLAGEDLIVTRRGIPVVRLVAIESSQRRIFGSDAKLFEVPEDFDAPLSEEILDSFYQ